MTITKTLAVFSPTIGACSETFIKRHITDLFLGRTVVVCAYAADTVNEWEINDPALFIRNDPPLPRYIRIVRSIKRRLRLHHDPYEREAVMSEVNRVLKPGNTYFFTVPFLWPLHEIPYDEYRYTPFSIKRHLENSGFTNIKKQALGGWDASLAQMLGLWVRRRPIGKWKRKMLSRCIFPIYKHLVKNDVAPSKFSESVMVIGLVGTCVRS